MSKFKIAPKATQPAAAAPASVEAFAAGAAMVKSQAGDRPAKPVRLNLDLDPETHRRLKVRAAEAGKSIAQMVRELIDRELT
ncbi:plasmid partition protein ParG [Paraburkholderia strydomiana]|uniref:plasmid partition protein ParG n=1 Tax=Paraburkholderia strydomiana TaxID=1245417 RepID=UPI0038B94B3B